MSTFVSAWKLSSFHSLLTRLSGIWNSRCLKALSHNLLICSSVHKCNTDVNDKDSEIFATRRLGQEVVGEERVWRSSKQVVPELLLATHRPKPCRKHGVLLATLPSVRMHQKSTCSFRPAFNAFSRNFPVCAVW